MSWRPVRLWYETFSSAGHTSTLPQLCRGRTASADLRSPEPGWRSQAPPIRPAGDPVAQSVACVRPTVSPPVRRPNVGEAAVLRLLRTDSSAGLAGHVKRRPQSPGTDGIHGVRLRGVNLHSARSSALSGRRGSGDIRFMVRGERQKADHVGFLKNMQNHYSPSGHRHVDPSGNSLFGLNPKLPELAFETPDISWVKCLQTNILYHLQ